MPHADARLLNHPAVEHGWDKCKDVSDYECSCLETRTVETELIKTQILGFTQCEECLGVIVPRGHILKFFGVQPFWTWNNIHTTLLDEIPGRIC